MSTRQRRLLLAASFAALATLGACIQMPTEERRSVELRSGLTFVLQDPQADIAGWRVSVDGLDVGALSELTAGRRTLQVLPGNHVVRVGAPQGLVHEERVFVAEGATKSILVPRR